MGERLLVAGAQHLVGQRLVIAVYVERFVLEVWFELLDGPHDSLELGETCRVVFLGGGECAAEVDDWAPYVVWSVLQEDRPEAFAAVTLVARGGVDKEVEVSAVAGDEVADGGSGREVPNYPLEGSECVVR